MKARMVIASGTLTANGVTGTIVDFEEVDGWVAQIRDDNGKWSRWKRADGAAVWRLGDGQKPWCAADATGAMLCGDGHRGGRELRWKTAEAARRAVDERRPVGVRAFARGGAR